MKHFAPCIAALATALICAAVWLTAPATAAFLYKSYLVKSDRGREILCDPYVVQKNDYVLKLLRQKGEIAAEDFPEFLAVFQRINSHIRDINLIRPGEQIYIPLRILRANEMPGQSTGVVTIPYVTIGSSPEGFERRTEMYRARRGDCVSKLIAARFGDYGSDRYWEGIRMFRMLNPTVTDLDRIYAGQQLRLPTPSMKEASWYAQTLGLEPALTQTDPVLSLGPAGGDKSAAPKTPLEAAAEALGADLLDRGSYFFPRPGVQDFRLDLSLLPAMEFEDGWLVLLPEKDSPTISAISALEPFPKRAAVVEISPAWQADEIVEAVLERTGRARPTDRLVVTDGGIRMEIRARWITGKTLDETGAVGRVCIIPLKDCTRRVPPSIVRYLAEHDVLLREICPQTTPGVRAPVGAEPKPIPRIDAADRRSFAAAVLAALGCQYSPNVSISFPYAGVQIKAQSNLVALPDGREFLVDFGDLYGDAIAAIEKTGFSVVQIHQQDRRKILQTLLEAMGRGYRIDPTFLAADREGPYNVAVTISGFLAEGGADKRLLLSSSVLHHRIGEFLGERGIRAVEVSFLSGTESS